MVETGDGRRETARAFRGNIMPTCRVHWQIVRAWSPKPSSMSENLLCLNFIQWELPICLANRLQILAEKKLDLKRMISN